MCLNAMAFQCSKKFPFVMIHNRDEFREREFEPSHFWPESPWVLGGKDRKSHGMWIGVTQQGQFAALLNFRDPALVLPNATSRGFIVKNFLAGQFKEAEFVTQISPLLSELKPFNLLFGTFQAPYYFSSRSQRFQKLNPGYYGLSNALLDTPWPKVESAKKRLEEVLKADLSETSETLKALFSILEDTTPAEPALLPSTGLSPQMEYELSPIFVNTPTYGTVTSTVILADAHGHVYYSEKVYRKTKV